MTKKAALLTFVGLVAVFTMAVGDSMAQRREARPGQARVRNGNPVKTGGPDCASATSMDPASGDMFNFADSDNTCGETNKILVYNNVTMGGVCNAFDYPGPDLIYRYSLAGPVNNVAVTLQQTAPADLALFIVTDCPNGQSCIAFEDQIGGGATENIVLTNRPAGSYWAYVDSYYTSGSLSCGNYTITLTGNRPVELMDFTVE